MNRTILVMGLLACLALGLSACVAIPPQAPVAQGSDVASRIANAMSAAPLAVAKDATILDWPAKEGGDMVVLRQGTNGWTCMTDMPPSPGNDPACYDAMWMAWNDALAASKDPQVTAVGVSYMLQGGSDPSNTDPSATKPAPGDEWVSSPPHVMLIRPEGFDPKVFSTDPKAPVFLMWAGTPFQHLHVGIPAQPEATQESNEKIKSAMSAAPLAIAKDTTILDWPAKEGGDMVVLRKGTNGWTCYTDWPASPGNDPECNDAVMEAWFRALMAGEKGPPKITGPGIAYMLMGGSDPSNTDPTATAPAPGEGWVNSPAHIMLLEPGSFDAKQFTTDHKSGYPYIMWDGTPYEHMMIPVADMKQ